MSDIEAKGKDGAGRDRRADVQRAGVVWSEPLAERRADVWHHRVAVQLDGAIDDCAAEIKDLAALGVPRD